jgi:hypothetical protein
MFLVASGKINPYHLAFYQARNRQMCNYHDSDEVVLPGITTIEEDDTPKRMEKDEAESQICCKESQHLRIIILRKNKNHYNAKQRQTIYLK